MLSRFKKEKVVYSPQIGTVVNIEDVPDEVFSAKMMGEGFAVIPEKGEFYSPVSGEITVVVEPSLHAYGISTNDGLEVLVHIGVDTVNLNGKGFKSFVKNGDKVNVGDKLGEMDLDLINNEGYPSHMIVVITNSDELKSFHVSEGKINNISEKAATYSVK